MTSKGDEILTKISFLFLSSSSWDCHKITSLVTKG